jgi:hypothetical protein
VPPPVAPREDGRCDSASSRADANVPAGPIGSTGFGASLTLELVDLFRSQRSDPTGFLVALCELRTADVEDLRLFVFFWSFVRAFQHVNEPP